MNNKAQASILAIMLAMAMIVLALGIAYAVWQGSNNAYTDMDCNNSTISDFTKASCYVNDINPTFFIGGLIALAGMVAVAKIIYG